MSATEDFAFLLALELGITDPYAMMRKMPATTFNAWRQFWRRHPFGPEGNWLQNGTLAAVVMNSNPFGGKDSKAVGVADFMPPDPDRKKTAMESMNESDRLVLAARMMGARIVGAKWRANRV